MKPNDTRIREWVPPATYARMKGISKPRVTQKIQLGHLEVKELMGGRKLVRDKLGRIPRGKPGRPRTRRQRKAVA